MNVRLLIGRMGHAWHEYPAVRRRIAAVPGGVPIFLTGTHRSGTTWLAKMLAESGIWYLHEPFAPLKNRWNQSFSYRRSSEPDPAVDAIFEDVLRGGFRSALNLPNADHPLMPLRLFRPKMQRLLVKDPLGCLLTEYLTRRHQLQTLVLFRHPAGFVASICRLGWPCGEFLRQFLADEALMDDHLAPYRMVLNRYANEDSIASAAVLHGALNTVLWRFVQAGVGTAVHFEELCRDPLDQLQRLFALLLLPYNHGIREAHHLACFGKTRGSDAYHPHAVNRNSLEMADSWRVQVAPADLRKIREIWELFEVPLYRDSECWQGPATLARS